ncbi:SAM-dependent methyltransferase [Actinoplanes tereljensis]|uniref:Methyltransferase type 11 n=1 Tax=Paractinoplanes tereljensis TaxID=571912 RepID=A0A919TXV0_9ACTN|nr:methyltransferase domain-containing protein [Actinoplanes tereljensis]GIF24575.1 methyltransferase type 11 [Actinoplanes tereljensis]
MTLVFGEVASIYDDVRPGYPDEVRQAILDYAGGPPPSVVELGAGTGKGTELLLRLGAPLTAIEPDPRMAAVLAANFPAAEVVTSTFEAWQPTEKPGLIACAMAWHWMDRETRNSRAWVALRDGGTLAIFYHRYGYADPAQEAAIDELLNRLDPDVVAREEHWVLDDVTAAGLWSDVEERRWHRYPVFDRDRYLALMQTFSPFRRHSPEVRQRALRELGALLDSFGGEITLDLRTSLVLGKKR